MKPNVVTDREPLGGSPARPMLVLAKQVLVAVLWVTAVSVIGQKLTDLGPWYQALRQPDWKPPDWAFGVIWSSIFVLIIVAAVWAWRRARHPSQRVQMLALWGVNSMLHITWSLLFFTMKRPDWAMVELLFLWLSIAAVIWTLWGISRWAAVLLVPYISWVTVAGFLNYANVQLNGPFDRPAAGQPVSLNLSADRPQS